MKKLVVVADDLGTLPVVNEGTFYLSKFIPTLEMSLSPRAGYVQQAVKMIKEEKYANVGIHLELINYLDLGHPPSGSDYKELYEQYDHQHIEDLAKQELEQFESLLGRPPTHITSHKGIHGNFKLLNFVILYAKERQIPIRKPITAFEVELSDSNYAAEVSLSRAGLYYPTHLVAHMLGNDLDLIKQQFINDLEKVSDSEVVEIAIHPSFFDEDLLKHSSLNYHRTRDIVLFSDPQFLETITNMGFEFCNYKDLIL